MRNERGFALPELLVSIAVFGIVLTAILQMVTITTGNQARISQRVSANQRARPVMTQLVNNLRSACVQANVAPVLAGSNATTLAFTTQSGSAITPVPDKHQVTLTGDELRQTVWSPATSSTPLSGWNNRLLLDSVGPATSTTGSTLPLFRYYKLGYVSNKLVPVAQAVPLTAQTAAETAMVDIAFKSLPARPDVRETTEGISFSDSVTLRFEAGSPSTSRPNLPCA